MGRASRVNHGGTAAAAVPEFGSSVKGREVRTAALLSLLSVLAVAAFFGGRTLGRTMGAGEMTVSGPSSAPSAAAVAEPGGQGSGDSSPPAAIEVIDETGKTGETEAGVATTTAGIAPGGETLRFVPFRSPAVVIDAETSPQLNNSVGVDTSEFDSGKFDIGESDGGNTRALVADLVVRGPGGSTVSVHPGDRPDDAVRFTIPNGGRLLVPHLIAPTDDSGRILVSASDHVEVSMDGIGRYVPAARAGAGRFVATESVQIGSLVTATDGRTLTMPLPDVLGDEAGEVGQAVVRLNANVGQNGGSVAVGGGPPIPWPGPATSDLGLAGTELLTVTPDEAGVITMTYLGGSVMTVDLVGYYTNDTAAETGDGLLVLSPEPVVQTVEIGEGIAGADHGEASLRAAEPAAGQTVAVIEAVNGGAGGAIRFWTEPDPAPDAAAFALAPGQQRSTTEWFDSATGAARVSGPTGSTLRIWTIGTYTGSAP